VASFCSGVAWHDEQPPMRNIVRPFCKFGVCVSGTNTALAGIDSGKDRRADDDRDCGKHKQLTEHPASPRNR
jgi:hypothetical protein